MQAISPVRIGPLKGLNITTEEQQQALASSLLQFSGLTRLAVSVSMPAGLHQLAQSRIAPLITHVDLPWMDQIQMSASLQCLPKLRSMSLHADLDAELLLPLSLEELTLRHVVCRDASPLTRLSRLTRLRLLAKDGAAPSLVSLTGLHGLRSLYLWCTFTPWDVLNTFTMLTSLNLQMSVHGRSGTVLPALAHITGLADLTLSRGYGVTCAEFACLSHLTKLTCLNFDACLFTESVRGSSALAPLTGLVRLRLGVGDLGASLLPHVNVEALQSLALKGVTGEVSALRRASGLTGLVFASHSFRALDSHELGPALYTMSGLCSLDLRLRNWRPSRKVFRLSRILRALTCLTSLYYEGVFSVAHDMQACASLPYLRSLGLSYTPEVTVACLPTLQRMSGLTDLSLWYTGIRREDLTPKVRAVFDVERLRRGWPCLKLQCS